MVHAVHMITHDCSLFRAVAGLAQGLCGNNAADCDCAGGGWEIAEQNSELRHSARIGK